MSSYENYIVKILQKEKIRFVREKTFEDLREGKFRFDFYIANYGGRAVIVEVDGEQHFKPIYGRQSFLKAQEHDRRKNSYCLAKGILLYRIPYWEIKNVHCAKDIFCDKFLVKTRWHSDNLQAPR